MQISTTTCDVLDYGVVSTFSGNVIMGNYTWNRDTGQLVENGGGSNNDTFTITDTSSAVVNKYQCKTELLFDPNMIFIFWGAILMVLIINLILTLFKR